MRHAIRCCLSTVVGALALSCSTAAAETPTDGYTFFLDGTPKTFPVTTVAGRPGEPAPGDVILVNGIPLTLGPERQCHFRSAREGVLLELPDGGTRLVGVRVAHAHIDDDYVLVDGMAALSEDQVRALWGLSAETWTPSCAQKAKWLDESRVAISVGQSVTRGTQDLPDLPKGLRYLHATRLLGWGNVSALRELVFLDANPEGTLDVRLLQTLTKLRTLRLSSDRLEHVEALAQLTALETLDLGYSAAVTDVGFAAQLTRMHSIDLAHTPVQDLSPLSRLDLLNAVDARGTVVTRLPDGPLPTLREFNLMGAPVSEEAVNAFRRAHPSAHVQHDWNQAFREAIAGTNRLRISYDPRFFPTESATSKPYETSDPVEIAELTALLTVDEQASNGVCGCICGPDFQFRRDEALLATASFACGSSIKWAEWPEDGALPSEKIAILINWLARRGVTGPRDEAQADKARADVYDRKRARATSGMSARLREAFEQDARIVGQTAAMPKQPLFPGALARELPVAADRIRLLLRIYGADNDWRGGLGPEDQIAEHLLARYPLPQLAPICETALLGNDRQVRRGAARLWHSSRSSLKRWRPVEPLKLRSAQLTVMQESRTPADRQDALSLLRVYWKEMPAPEREQRLQAGLRDPGEAVRRRAMIVAGQVGEASAEELLLRVLKGEPVEMMALPLVPAEEEEDPGRYEEPIASDEPAAEVAALALGYMRSRPALPLVEERSAASSSSTWRVARALQDERCDLLTPDDFQAKARGYDQAVQLAALEAVVRCRGRHGMDFALAERKSSAWWEGDAIVSELKRMLLAARAPGSEALRTVKTLPQLRGWYHVYGQKYLRRFGS
jgi:hypothetical protein